MLKIFHSSDNEKVRPQMKSTICSIFFAYDLEGTIVVKNLIEFFPPLMFCCIENHSFLHLNSISRTSLRSQTVAGVQKFLNNVFFRLFHRLKLLTILRRQFDSLEVEKRRFSRIQHQKKKFAYITLEHFASTQKQWIQSRYLKQ